jgi:YVTN family beta-propeller protein
MKMDASFSLRRTAGAVVLVAAIVLVSRPDAGAATPPALTKGDRYLSPTALAVTKDGRTLFIACATAGQVVVFDTASRSVTRTIPVPESPTGLTLSSEEKFLYVTCAAPESRVCVLDVAKGRVADTFPAGHTAMAPVLSPDGKTLLVCNRFNNDVSVFDLPTKKEVRRVTVRREPVAAAITSDGKFLLVANLLHNGRADADYVAAVVSVIDVAAGKVSKELLLPNGSGSLNDIRVSPDGKYAIVTHILSRFHLPTTQLDRGWMNTNAKTIIDLARMEILNTVLLDNVDSGAANPWGVAWSADSATVVVALAGTHELSVINFPALLAKLAKLPATLDAAQEIDYSAASRIQTDVPNDLSFLVGVRRRLKLPETDRGPRAVVLVGTKAYAADYFSDTLSVVDVAAEYPKWASIPLGPRKEMSIVRKGEFYFHDATICFQGWQSCASCHPGEARVDGLNWDLLNDGIGNPKNNKSLLLAHKTPPAMSMGVRETAEDAVRAGIKHILFTVQPEEVPAAMDEYLKSLKPVPSPYLVKGELSAAARRGKTVYRTAGCAECHPPGLFTDLRTYDVGTRGPYDKPSDQFDTPTLVELWRTAPYLHDGSAATMRDVLTTHNTRDQHGKTSNLTPAQIYDLCAYLLSL